MEFFQKEKEMIVESVTFFNVLRKEHPNVRTMDFSLLYSVLPKDHLTLSKRILALSPKSYGFRGEYHGINEVPSDLVVIRRQYFPKAKKTVSIGTHFLPRVVYNAYHKMNRAMLREIDKKVFIESGYRSPAYQFVVFLEQLVESEFDIEKTLKRVALPGYSEHGNSKCQAVDFVAIQENDNVLSMKFEKTKEYQWLLERAPCFGFHLSYPRNNKIGVMFEPWHWRFEKPDNY